MKGIIIIEAGHDNRDPGAIAHDGTTEASLTKTLRDKVVAAIKRIDASLETLDLNGSVMSDNDNADLNRTIQNINVAIKGREERSFALSLHFNYNAPGATGAEAFVHPMTASVNRQFAAAFVNACVKTLGIGAHGKPVKNDTESAVKSLGFVRYTFCNAIVLEPCFLNISDLPKYRANHDKLAVAIAEVAVAYHKELND